MDDIRCRQFFARPTGTYQRRYEALRAFFVDRQSVAMIAKRLDYKPAALRVIISQFRRRCQRSDTPPFSSASRAAAPPAGSAAKIATVPTRPQRPTAGRCA